MRPLVSVLIPAYNAEPFIEASTASALDQTLGDLELIVIDDGSEDGTAERLRRCTDPRLRVIRQPHLGIASAYHAAIEASRGVYFGFLDADDMWLPEKLARHVQFLDEHPLVDVTFSWINTIGAGGKPIRMPCPRWRGTASFPQLLADYTIRTTSAVVMRKSAVRQAGPFDPRFIFLDVEFFLRVARLRPGNIHSIPEVLTLYRRHPAQATRDWRLMQKGWDQLLEWARQCAPEETAKVERLARSNMNRYFASIAYESGDFEEAVRLVRRGLLESPGAFFRDVRNWKMCAAAAAGRALPKPVLYAIEKVAGFERVTNPPPQGLNSSAVPNV